MVKAAGIIAVILGIISLTPIPMTIVVEAAVAGWKMYVFAPLTLIFRISMPHLALILVSSGKQHRMGIIQKRLASSELCLPASVS